MQQDKKSRDMSEQTENLHEDLYENGAGPGEQQQKAQASEAGDVEAEEMETLKNQLNDKSRQCEEYFGMLQRSAAEFDNFRKRTAREKEALYSEAVSDTVSAFLPVVDNLDRALAACCKDGEPQSLREGVELVSRQMKEVLKKLGIEEIASVGVEFNPELHNAVMHIEDDTYGHNVVVEEFQKGYKLKEKVIRHSMVKVAN